MKELLLYVKMVLFNKTFMWLLFIVNLVGTIYGYIWYEGQLSQTETKFLLFVPDSPTASLFFTLALFAWLLKKNWKLIEALALITLVKYGLWAVVMNVWTYVENDYLGWMGWMLVASHFAMAVQAILYIPNYRFTWIHIFIAAIWTLHNDVIDYVFDQMPTYRSLYEYADQIGYFTFWLSIACITLASFIYQRRSKLIS
ncbi:DUF1405 domain-containing protein [Psychrobacillus sp. BM2]|uniref:DUF1405 domain-containing protein n=1 Tax=Psychrobacillus sp. BM2 TaxID=3400421 RepID=UPI003B01232E